MSGEKADRIGKWLAIGGTVLAVVAIVLAIRMMGSPSEQRLVRIDEHRVSDLDKLEDAIVAYAKEKERLPAQIAQVKAQPGTITSFTDPETRAPYEYERIDADRFRICAVFATDTSMHPPEGWPASQDAWNHGIGRHCFTRDKDGTPTLAKDLVRAL
ncbi:hypothetical protein LF41_1453 [Lysobacter dokdonensis DS-58]|uniref:Uncharacterized protein n=1 Tax=Lysobacter dokdonensis DS-58 TaxID=1300345 RepID=A0A0A2WYN9_9GAMM|nr:hypothetical protein [Lysobacter dokdonensis]KGQ18099.1 hypothetical protein LF41_1453 [Lysobacter dokdonensis DS-58]